MRSIYKIIVLFTLINSGFVLNAKSNSLYIEKGGKSINANIVALPTATISGTTSVCLNAVQPQITFTGVGGTAPYTFIYKINAGSDLIVQTTSGSSVSVNVPTGVAGNFIYTLVSITDSSGTQAQIGKATVTVNTLPTISGTLHTCIGSTSSLIGSGTITSWTSSNPLYATVDNTGIVSGIAVGTTNITYTNSNGCQKTVVFTVEPVPVVDFNSNATSSTCSGSPILFTSSIIAGTAPYTYAWDFGDGTTSTDQNPIHPLTSLGCGVGSVPVKLTITDASGCSSVQVSHDIAILQKPDISFKDNNSAFSPFSNCRNASSLAPAYTISVGNTSASSSCISSYSIVWGDGSSESSVVFPITHTYAQLGAYNMVLSALGTNGCSNAITYVVKNVTNPSGGIVSPGSTSNLCAPTVNIDFKISAWGNNSIETVYDIDYGDNSPIIHLTQSQLQSSTYYNTIDPSASANYPIPHTYTATTCPAKQTTAVLTITNACSTTTGSVSNITIYIKPTANFVAPTIACLNSNVLFTNTTITGFNNDCSQNAIYTWDFGDGSPTQSTQDANHTYTIPGNYTVTLSAEGYCGVNIKTQQICIEKTVTPVFTLNTTEGCSPVTLTATNNTNIVGSCSPPTYLWKVSYASGYCGSGVITIPDQTTQDATYNFVKPGTYSITLTTTNSCGPVVSPVQTVIVKQPPTVVINPMATNCVNTLITPSVLVNSCSTTINTGLNYLWTFNGGTPSTSTSVTPPTVSYATSGNYSIKLEVTNECGTTSATSNTFTINPKPIIQNETTTICSGSSFLITPSALTAGNVIPLGTTYSWGAPVVTGGITGGLSGTNQSSIGGTLINSATTDQTATYTVTPTTGSCAGIPFTVIITVSSQIVITSSQANVSCFGNSDGTATITVTGGTAPYLYSWNTIPPQNSAIATGLIAGNYTVTVTDATNCTKVKTIKITQPAVLSLSISAQTNVSCFGGSNGSATALATGGTAPYTYSWDAIPVQTSATATGLIAGIYNVTVTDGKGCLATKPVIITEPLAALDATSSQTNVSCFGDNTGSVTVLVTGGTAPYSYSWNTTPLQTTATATGLLAGSYSVVITDANGCTKTESFAITQPATGLTTAITSQTNLTCFGGNNGSATVTASGGVGVLTYSWNTNPVQTLDTATGLTAGTYTVTVKDVNGCSKTEQVIIMQPNAIAIIATKTDVSCFGNSDGTATAIVTGGTGTYTYSWSTFPVQTSATATGLIAGSYTVTVTDANSCVESQTITISQPVVLDATSSQINVSCFAGSNGSATVLVTGGTAPYLYSWDTIPVQNLAAATGLIAGNYNVTITDSKGCSKILPVTITQPTAILDSSISAQTDVACFGSSDGSATVLATGGTTPYSYLWNTSPVQTLATATGLAAGIHNVIITDANGCTKNQSVTIQSATGIISSATSTNLTCFGGNNGTATATASGGSGTLTYSWNTIPVQNTAAISGLPAGTYTVTIADASSCSKTEQVTITQPTEILTSETHTDINCFGNSSGSATVSVSGGTSPYSYSWNTIPVQTLFTATGLTAGAYNATVTDNNGCQKVQVVNISQPLAALSSSISSSNNVSCSGGNNGNATVVASGGTAPYIYSWNTIPAQTLATATGLAAGTYSVLVTDAKGCTTSSPVTITEPLGMTATTSQTDVFCSGDSTGTATVVATGGIGSYIYSWNTVPIQNSSTATNLKAGIYSVTILDGNSCSITKQVTITEPNGIVTSISSQTNVDCFGNNTGAATILAIGGNGLLSFSWNTIPVVTTATATGLAAGIYNVTVTDANGCSKIQTVTITQPAAIVITTDVTKNVSCFGNANGSIAITITGGTPNYTFAWTKNGNPYATTEDLVNLSPGNYVVTVSDVNNCALKSATFAITEPPVLAVNLVNKTDILCFGDSTGAINTNITGGTLPYTYTWTGPNGFTSSAQNLVTILAGTYNLKVTDNLGCSVNLSPVTITQTPEIIITATTTPIICYGANNGSIRIAISGGNSPYQITWSNLGSGTFQNNLSSGNYLITVTDALNCVKTLNVNIADPPIFTINPVVKNISCFGANDGSINLNFVGGIAPITLKWSDGSLAGTTRNNLAPGSYTVTITDAKPCVITRTFIILEPQALTLSAIVTNAFDCVNTNSGAINLQVSGGTSPFIYAWSNGATTEDLSNIPAGNYLVSVTDVNGCSKQAQYSINRPPPIVAGVTTKTDFDCATKYVKQTFVAQVSGGMPPYQLAWSSGTVSGANNELMNTNQNGTVILNVTDKLGCPANYSFNVNIPTLGSPSFNISSYAFSTFGIYSVKDPIQFTNTATGDFISMSWDFGDGSVSTETNPIHTFLKEGSQVVIQTVTYPFGCVYTNTMTIKIEKGYELISPNAFTPNGDGINETFRPVTKGLKSIYLSIYDTWGELIYSENGDILRGWDGKIKGKDAENGNFYYKVSAMTFYGDVINESNPFVLIK